MDLLLLKNLFSHHLNYEKEIMATYSWPINRRSQNMMYPYFTACFLCLKGFFFVCFGVLFWLWLFVFDFGFGFLLGFFPSIVLSVFPRLISEFI